MPFNDDAAKEIITYIVNTIGLEEDIVRKLRYYLFRLQAELIRELEQLDTAALKGGSIRQLRLTQLLKQAALEIKATYKKISTVHEEQLVELFPLTSKAVDDGINKTLGIDIMSTTWTAQQINALMGNVLIEGAPSATWWARQGVNLQNSFSDQIRLGVLKGESVNDLVRRVRGTATGRRHTYIINGKKQTYVEFTGGLMDTSTRHAAALVRTSVQAVNNKALLETYKENGSVIKGVQALVTLDLRTSLLCMSRSQFAWNLEGEPLNKFTTIPFPGPPPWHWGCRTVLVPVVKSWAELLKNEKYKKLDELAPKGTQASMDGQVASNLTYEDWLRSKPVKEQKEVLGIGRWQLWQAGKLSFNQLTSQTGKVLTIKELATK